MKNLLCSICMESFPQMKLERLANKLACHDCMLHILRYQQQHPKAQPESTAIRAFNKLPESERDAIGGELASIDYTRLLLSAARAAAYCFTFTQLAPTTPIQAGLAGILFGDVMSWLVFSALRLPFAGLEFTIEFVMFAGVSTYLMFVKKAINVPLTPDIIGMFGLALLATVAAKLLYLNFRFFLSDSEED